MKILILNGSPRKQGATSHIVNHMESSLAGRADVEQIRVYGQKIAPCIGCHQCRPDKLCVLPEDDAQRIARKIDEADALVLASPTYWGNITGPMKTLFDRMVTTFEYLEGHSIPRKMQKGKNSLILTVSNAPPIYNQLPSQSRGAVRSMKTILKAGGFRVRGVINVPDSSRLSKREHRILGKTERLIRRLALA